MSVTYVSARLEKGLADSIDKLIENMYEHGTRKYLSRSDFVKEACLKLINEEIKKVEVKV